MHPGNNKYGMYYLKQMNKEYEKANPIRSTEANLRYCTCIDAFQLVILAQIKSGTAKCPKNVIIEFMNG